MDDDITIGNLLQKGITGFRSQGDGEAQSIDYCAFKARCFKFARCVEGEVLYIDEPSNVSVRSYYIAQLGNFKKHSIYESFGIVINKNYPILGCVTAGEPNEYFQLDYLDVIEVFRFFKDRFIVLSKDQLNQTLDSRNTKFFQNLYDDEVKQIQYWEPSRLGDVIFNSWD
jgi:hypothetical protein